MDTDNATQGVQLAWADCWRFALELHVLKFDEVLGFFSNGLGMQQIAGDSRFAMLATSDLVASVCLRRIGPDERGTRGPVSIMFMVTNFDDVQRRVSRVANRPVAVEQEGVLRRFEVVMAEQVKVIVWGQ